MTAGEIDTARVLLLPGWQDSGPEHWQSRWEILYRRQQQRCSRVEQADWLWPRRGDWMARLDEALLEDPAPALLVAHSLGCQLVAAWAAHSRHTGRVLGAMLVAPPDTERTDTPPNLFNWRPIVRRPLPFRSLAVISANDPFCTSERALQMAADWGAEALDIGNCGHINSDSGLADWPAGQALLRRLRRRAPAVGDVPDRSPTMP